MANSLRIIFVIAAIVTVCSATTDEQKKIGEGHLNTCQAKIDEIGFMCFAKCFFEEYGFLKANGEFSETAVVEALSLTPDVAAKVKDCKLEAGPTPCLKAFKIYECYVKNNAFGMRF